jgi:hypothetical protein
LLLALDRTGPGHHADIHPADLHLKSLHDSRLGFQFTAGELVRCQNRQHLVDAGAAFERPHPGDPLVADDGDDGPLGTFDDIGLQPLRFHMSNHGIDIRFGGRTFHDDDHRDELQYMGWGPCKASPPVYPGGVWLH